MTSQIRREPTQKTGPEPLQSIENKIDIMKIKAETWPMNHPANVPTRTVEFG
jgi:hypothetical protein